MDPQPPQSRKQLQYRMSRAAWRVICKAGSRCTRTVGCGCFRTLRRRDTRQIHRANVHLITTIWYVADLTRFTQVEVTEDSRPLWLVAMLCMTAGDIKKLEVFETYCYRVQTNITLVEIMRQCRWHIEREFINTVKRRKL